MYLDRPKKNTYTVGKSLRRNKALRKKDQKSVPIPLNVELQAYKEDLEKQGLIVGPLEVAMFQTNNGLKYPGFVAKQKILANTVLLRVPVDCLLTTRDAFMSQIQKVFEQNPKFYAKQFSADWEDRILLTYLLFEHQKGKKSKWYHLLANLPRDIDYVAFWPEQQLKQLEDTWLENRINKQKARVLSQQQELINIAKKYPQWFDMSIFTAANITWIHVHLVTRCFGKYFEYTTMVPYAQLFNHECVDVYYTMTYKDNNPHNTHQDLLEPVQLTEQEENEADTSDGSYNASDVSCSDEDFQEEDIEEPNKSKHQAVANQYKAEHSYLCAFISFNDQVSLFYLEKIYSAIEQAMTMDLSEGLARMTKVHAKNVKYLKLVKQFFYKIGSNRYSYGIRQKKIWGGKQKQKHEPNIDSNAQYFGGKWAKDKFDDFVMVCGSKDQFEQGSQVYFCYGRLPNRLLLMRYGIALEHNKYDHLFIRLDISKHVYKCKALQRAVQSDIVLKKYRRFKIKRTVFCNELVVFYRAMLWNFEQSPDSIFGVYHLNRELEVMKFTKGTLTQKLNQFSCSLEHNQQKLKDETVGYHQYFAIVYKVQRQRILKQQINMIDYATEMLLRIDKGQVLQDILRKETAEERLRWQVMMETYLRSFCLF